MSSTFSHQELIITHNLGMPKIGDNRQLKTALEAFWQTQNPNDIDYLALINTAKQICNNNQQLQQQHGQVNVESTLDFAYYDSTLNISLLLNHIPSRFKTQANQTQTQNNNEVLSSNLKDCFNTYFRMARGQAYKHDTQATFACEMTKWFNTNYHYLVPEFEVNANNQFTQEFSLNTTWLEHLQSLYTQETQANKIKQKPVLVGPFTYLMLGKFKTQGQADTQLNTQEIHAIHQQILPNLVQTYAQLIHALSADWVQLDEPYLTLELSDEQLSTYNNCYTLLKQALAKLNCTTKQLQATYFSKCDIEIAKQVLKFADGIHLDGQQLAETATFNELKTLALHCKAHNKVLSLGVINGRNIWKTDLEKFVPNLQQLQAILAQPLWLAPSCSLMHVPYTLQNEHYIEPTVKAWLSFAQEKLEELHLLAKVLTASQQNNQASIQADLQLHQQSIEQRKQSSFIQNSTVQFAMHALNEQIDTLSQRQDVFANRKVIQQENFNLPLFPTTTIGSFPQTKAIRQIRQQFKQGKLPLQDYRLFIEQTIQECIEIQEKIGLDMLVHGESERNDMVEYFATFLEGYVMSSYGWVQSYGSRCVKPPIIFGDIARKQAMTVEETVYAQSLTQKIVKGMLTGPVTMLNWSFVRDDQPVYTTAYQLALAIREEVSDLEANGIQAIQIDEPALREGLPIKQSQHLEYLNWAVTAFKLSSCSVKNSTQIHTHMCYSEFNDILEHIAALDADVITIEASRSDMDLLKGFAEFSYPNDIGPGIYDIHSPNIPTVDGMHKLLEQACKLIDVQNLWVNPDCGLKTRQWPEVELALGNMVQATKRLREQHSQADVQNKTLELVN